MGRTAPRLMDLVSIVCRCPHYPKLGGKVRPRCITDHSAAPTSRRLVL
ncbi:hypothetical protein [Acidithiobacillus sulfuriphilus]